MAAKITVKPKIEISCITCKFVGYMMFRNQIPFIQRLHISNPGLIELQDLELSFRSEPEFIIPIKKEVKVLPLKQTVAVDCVDVCLSPLFLGNLSSVCEGKLFIQVSQNGKVLGEGSYTTKILPFDYMGNIDSYTELLASFVKPRAAGINQLLLEAQAILKSWKMPTEMSGYEGAEKNHIRQIAAAIYTAIQKRQIKKIPTLHDYDGENRILSAAEILEKKEATYLDISLLYSSCLEAAGINPIIVIGKDKVNVCFWLYENCMNESVSDDLSMLIKRTSDGINEIAGADIASLFVGAKLNFAGAEKEAYANFNQPSWFDYIIDIRRCRFGAIRALPERIATAHGYDMVAEEDTEIGAKPAEIKGTKRLDTKFAASRERQWERRLLDLSLRNTLLNFKVNSNVVHVLSTNLSETVNRVAEGGEFLLLEEPKDSTGTLSGINTFGSQITASTLQELVSLELKNKRLHCLTDQKSMISSLSGLYRRERTCLEETGAGTLYLAAGFLKWHERNDRYNEKYAPLVLLPVALVKKESGKGFSLKIREEEVQLNTTLLEFLMQEFGVDIRGLAEFKKEEFSLPDIIATVRSAILNLKNWDVVQDVYIASFSFTRFLMWNDVHYHIEEFKKNKLVSSLIHNKSDFSNKDLTISDVNVDEDYTPQEILTPISADSSQFAAIAAMHEGKSFVLHGPPGTGKSQTITNIIADALYQGKRVLFVAEKMAALSVVKKRLDEIGIGDFCLELHSNKVNKVEVAERILRTLSLSGVNASEFNRTANQIAQMRKDLNEEIQALHRVRRLNISVYDAIVRYNQNKFAPDCIDIESTFFDQLDADSLDRYENLLLEISAAAIESGGVYNSPFSNLELFEYNADLQNNLIISGKILTEEIRHFKNYTEMVFDILGSHVRTLTQKKLESLVALCEMMTSESAEFDIFKAEDNRQVLISIKTYLNLLKDYDSALQKYNKQYKILVELPASYKQIAADLHDFGKDYKKSPALKALYRKMERVAYRRKADDLSIVSDFKLLLSIYDLQAKLENHTAALSSIFGGRKIGKEEAKSILYKVQLLFDTAEDLFSDYSFDHFTDICRKIFRSDKPNRILQQFIQSYKTGFLPAVEAFRHDASLTADYTQLDENYCDTLNAKVGALLDNLDILPSWCRFNTLSKKLEEEGLSFLIEPLLDGRLNGQNLVSCFRKRIYQMFVETEVKEDSVLSTFSGALLDEKIEKFRYACEDFEKLSRLEIYNKLISALPDTDTEGPLSLEIVMLSRAVKSNMRGLTLRKLFTEIDGLVRLTAPCLLMSPISVSQYLEPDYGMFDLVVFDEASQMPTSEAIGAIARGKSVIVVGDPKQLPPTSFFHSDYTDEDNLENEDLESILEDCLALGMPEKHLLWHYRSRHESLIAFSNTMYYGNRLNTFPSPDSLESKVTLRYVDGVYDRGTTKQNKKEAEALVAEVIARLKSPEKRKMSIGIVTFSTAQQNAVEDLLNAALIKNKLESIANNGDEPIFVKNLENVQGDERDVILFSVGYGPDQYGRLMLNFGPINQVSGWRRLNVAVTRARAEMVVFSSITAGMLDLSKTNSKGVAGLKAFLEFADKGKTMLAVNEHDVVATDKAIGYYIAQELQAVGFDCSYNVGVSDFKIDTAVMDPRNKKKYLLAILCDGYTAYSSKSAKDRTILQNATLKRLGWNVYRIWSINFFHNPKREIKKIRDYLNRLMGKTGEKKAGKTLSKYGKDYVVANVKLYPVTTEYIYNPENQKEIIAKMERIIELEQPIAKSLLIKRTLGSYGISRSTPKLVLRMEELIGMLNVKHEVLDKTTFFRSNDSILSCDFFRFEHTAKMKRSAEEIPPYEIIAAAKSVLEEKLNLFLKDLIIEVAKAFGITRYSNDLADRIEYGILLGVSRAIFAKSMNDAITIA